MDVFTSRGGFVQLWQLLELIQVIVVVFSPLTFHSNFVPSRSGRFGSSFRVGVPRSWKVMHWLHVDEKKRWMFLKDWPFFAEKWTLLLRFNLHQPEFGLLLVPLLWNSLRQRCLLLKLTKKQVPVEMMTSGDTGMFHQAILCFGGKFSEILREGGFPVSLSVSFEACWPKTNWENSCFHRM